MEKLKKNRGKRRLKVEGFRRLIQMSEKVASSELVEKKKSIIPGLAKKFIISEEKAKKFLQLAIEDCARSKYRLNVTNGIISGQVDKIKEMIKEVEGWTDDEFDREDFEIIGYCKNI